MESQIPEQRCLWDNGEGCMHIFCRNCPKTPGALRGRHGIWGKGKCWEEHMSATTEQETGGRVIGGHKGQKSEVPTPRQTS